MYKYKYNEKTNRIEFNVKLKKTKNGIRVFFYREVPHFWIEEIEKSTYPVCVCDAPKDNYVDWVDANFKILGVEVKQPTLPFGMRKRWFVVEEDVANNL